MYTNGYNYGYYDTSAASAAAAGVGAALVVYYILAIAFYVVLVIGMWKVFVKAGKAGWISLIPVYNMWTLYELGDQKGFWCLIPVANIIFYVKACLSLNKKFSKPTWFAFLMIFVPEVAFIILGFSKDKFTK